MIFGVRFLEEKLLNARSAGGEVLAPTKCGVQIETLCRAVDGKGGKEAALMVPDRHGDGVHLLMEFLTVEAVSILGDLIEFGEQIGEPDTNLLRFLLSSMAMNSLPLAVQWKGTWVPIGSSTRMAQLVSTRSV